MGEIATQEGQRSSKPNMAFVHGGVSSGQKAVRKRRSRCYSDRIVITTEPKVREVTQVGQRNEIEEKTSVGANKGKR